MVEGFTITFMVRLCNQGAKPIENHFITEPGDCPETKVNAVFEIIPTKGGVITPETG